MSQDNLILFNKPYGVLCQFTGPSPNLSDYIDEKGFYPAGRLDKDSEGLLVLTSDGNLQARIANPKHKMDKTYLVQVEGMASNVALDQLRKGVRLKDGLTRPARVKRIEPMLPEREPPVRYRRNQPTSWLEVTIAEGKNRQVRRMTAAVGYPTLRLFRERVGPWRVDDIPPGSCMKTRVNI